MRELIVTLGKAFRAYQLYEDNNPMYRRFVSALRDAFRRLWVQEDRLLLVVRETELLVDGVPAYRSETRAESLAFLLYKDGIRELTFLPGIEEEELERFLELLRRVRRSGPDSDDLVTLLWEEDFRNIRYTYVDFLPEGVVLPEPGEGAGPEKLHEVHATEVGELATEAPAEGKEGDGGAGEVRQPIDLEGFNPTLYGLDPGDMESLEREVQLEMARDLRGDVLNALYDRVEEAEHPERQSEILSIFRILLPNLLGRGELDAASQVLGELVRLERAGHVLDAQRQSEVSALLDEMSSPAVIGELLAALELGSITPTAAQLGRLLVSFRGQALAGLLRASEVVAVKRLQPVLREAVGRLAVENRKALVELLAAEDPQVAAGAARLAGALQISEAGSALPGLLRRTETTVRLAAIEASVALKASGATGALQESLTDEDRGVRMAAARALGQMRYSPAADRFRALLSGRAIRDADVTEKIAFFEGYGELGDPDAVPFLDRLLNGRSFLGRREPGEIRAAAALALGRVGAPEARRALEKASADDDAVVRSAVSRAFR